MSTLEQFKNENDLEVGLDEAGRGCLFGPVCVAGVIWLNCWMIRDLRTPFGGMKSSGLGREGGHEALEFFTEQKNICTPV